MRAPTLDGKRLHIRACYVADHERSDVRAMTIVREGMTDQLRAEIERYRPVLRWPLKSPTAKQEGITHGTKKEVA